MTTQLIPFQFDLQEVRVIVHDDGTPWWILSDVCAVLGIQNPSDVVKRLESTEYHTLDSSYTGQFNLKRVIVNEAGLYRVIFRSDKPDARRFQTWVFTDVLPAIRKTGAYHVTALPPVLAPGQQLLGEVAVMEQLYGFLDKYGWVEARDQLMVADDIRTKMVHLALPVPGSLSCAGRSPSSLLRRRNRRCPLQ